MYYITLITVGKQKPGAYTELTKEYQKRLQSFVKLELIEIAETKFSSQQDRDRVLKIEGEKIQKAIPKDSLLITLDAEGKEFNSIGFAKQMDVWSEHGAMHLTFLIGGPLGLHHSLKTKTSFSLSKLTFPHDLARNMFLEQLYRAMTILKGKTYHY